MNRVTNQWSFCNGGFANAANIHGRTLDTGFNKTHPTRGLAIPSNANVTQAPTAIGLGLHFKTADEPPSNVADPWIPFAIFDQKLSKILCR